MAKLELACSGMAQGGRVNLEIDPKAAFRIAFREEGKWWQAYFCRSLTDMRGALPIARIRLNLIANDAEIKQLFIDFCNKTIDITLKQVTDRTAEILGQFPAHESGKKN